MTRKDFVALAAEIAKLPNVEDRRRQAQTLLPALRDSNPRFDTARFLQACGL
jgi:hypothetical protein